MTEEELNRVRDIKRNICELEKHLRALRVAAENIVPILDGLPHSTLARSRVEKITLSIVENEQQLEKTLRVLVQAKSELADKIMGEIDKPELQTMLILRYVECCRFKDVAHRMHYSLRALFRIHERFIKEYIHGHLDA